MPAKIFYATAPPLLAVGMAIAQIQIAEPNGAKISPPVGSLLTNDIILGTNLYQNLQRPETAPVQPASGVYVTKPFAMKVKIPGAHPDDFMVRRPNEPTIPAQIFKPEMQMSPASTNEVIPLPTNSVNSEP